MVSSLRAKGLKVITNLRPVDSAEQYREMALTLNLVAYVDGGIPRVIPDAEGKALLPSIVAYTPDGVLVGEPARRQLVRDCRIQAVRSLASQFVQ